MDDLTPQMQSRLEEWRKRTLSVKSAGKVRDPSPGNYVPRQRDYGDDISDYEKKEDMAWRKEVDYNPTHRGYR